MTWGGTFPYGTKGPKPEDIICKDCGGDGWGPMLTKALWNSIVHPSVNHYRYFLCQPCIEKRLGRPLARGDLRDCPMNARHPMYRRNGAF